MRYRDGDASAFDGLYARHRGGVYRYLLRQTRSAQTAEELFQDVWMNLIRHRHRYEPTARFTTFVYRMAHNRFVDHCRRVKHRSESAETEHVEEQVDPAPDPCEHLSREESRAQFAAAVAELPEAQREAFLLRQETGLGVASIAEITGVNAETAKSRLRYAVNRLKRTLRGVA
jgi:RNA polymerase sigma-70 factor (ECF subfamily)